MLKENHKAREHSDVLPTTGSQNSPTKQKKAESTSLLESGEDYSALVRNLTDAVFKLIYFFDVRSMTLRLLRRSRSLFIPIM
jgi:hypothetical protein